MKSLIDRTKEEGSFFNFAFWSFSGRSLGIAAGLLLTPIVTRIYDPDSYGAFAFMNALITNLALFGSLKLPLAFVIPKKDREFHRLFRAVVIMLFLVAGGFTVLSLIFYFIFGGMGLSGDGTPSWWVLYIGPGVFLYVSWELVNNWKIRAGEFKRGASIGFTFNISTRLAGILYGLGWSSTGVGLIHGEFIGRLIGVLLYVKWVFRGQLYRILKGISWRDLIFSFKRYGNYPKFILPANWMNKLSAQSPILVFSFIAPSTTIGLYSLAVGMLNLPFRLLSGSLVPVMSRKTADIVHQGDPDRLLSAIGKLSTTLILSGSVPAFCVLFFGESVFSFVFGEDWRMAGLFAGVLVWSVWMSILSTTISSVYRIYRRENIVFYFNTILALLRLTAVLIGVIQRDFFLAILLFSSGNVLVYWIQVVYAHYFVSRKGLMKGLWDFLIFLLVLGISALIYLNN